MKHVKEIYPMISASVSCMDLLHLEEQIKEVEASGISFFHYDIVDGQFNQCFILGDTLLEQMRSITTLPIEVHLAAYQPEKYIKRLIHAGADYITVQYESLENPLKTIDYIRSCGAIPAICYKATTPPKDDFLTLAKEVAWILKLTVNPGFSGQTMQPASITHIEEMAAQLRKNHCNTPIQADGNVNSSTIKKLSNAGAKIFTGGTSGLFLKDHSIVENYHNLLSSL